MKKPLFAVAVLAAFMSPAWSAEKPTAIPTEAPAEISTSHSLPFGGLTEDASPTAETRWPLPMPAPTPEMSQYGWVGAWNWTLGAVGESDGDASRNSYSYGYYYRDYYSSLLYYESRDGNSSTYTQASMAFRLAAEKVLSSSFASRLELDYGRTEVSRAYKEHVYDSNGPYDYRYQWTDSYKAHLVALSWDLRANATGLWVPPGGWRMGWGPNGKAMRPSIETKLTLLNGISTAGGYSYGYGYGYGNGSTINFWGKIAVKGALPLFNGCTLMLGYANSIRRHQDNYSMDPAAGTRASFDTENFYETISSGLELAIPEFGQPDPTKDANPDGFLFHPKLRLLCRVFSLDGINSAAASYAWTLRLPVSPGSSLDLETEQFQTPDQAPVLQRYSLAWQLYASRPKPRIPRDDPEEVAPIVHPATPYHRPTEQR